MARIEAPARNAGALSCVDWRMVDAFAPSQHQMPRASSVAGCALVRSKF